MIQCKPIIKPGITHISLADIVPSSISASCAERQDNKPDSPWSFAHLSDWGSCFFSDKSNYSRKKTYINGDPLWQIPPSFSLFSVKKQFLKIDMPSQHFPDQTIVPDFKQLVLYTGNVMLTSTTATAGKHWNKKSNTEVGFTSFGRDCMDGSCMSRFSWSKQSLTHWTSHWMVLISLHSATT